MQQYLEAFKKFAQFEGRSRRKEYWMFLLFNLIFAVVLAAIGYVINSTILSNIYALIVLVPSLALTVRRLHDVGKSGWFLFIALIPLVGAIWLIVLYCTNGQPGENKYGPNPKGE